MSRDILLLWRWEQATDSEGELEFDSIGGQMKRMHRGDRLFICAVSQDYLYVFGILEVRTVKHERNARLRDIFGEYRAICQNLSGVFRRVLVGALTWKLRFVNTPHDRLKPDVALAMQLRQHRFLSRESAEQLAGLFGEDVRDEERERHFLEGDRRASVAMRASRSTALRIEARRRWGPQCYCCGFDFADFYGPAGDGIAIVHHMDPLGARHGRRRSTVDDVRIVCANCHHVIHRENPPLHVDDLKKLMSRRRGGRG